MNTKRPNNLTKEELSKKDDIIITNADKRGAIVVMDIDRYISEAQHQLNDGKITKNFKQIRLYNTTN